MSPIIAEYFQAFNKAFLLPVPSIYSMHSTPPTNKKETAGRKKKAEAPKRGLGWADVVLHGRLHEQVARGQQRSEVGVEISERRRQKN